MLYFELSLSPIKVFRYNYKSQEQLKDINVNNLKIAISKFNPNPPTLKPTLNSFKLKSIPTLKTWDLIRKIFIINTLVKSSDFFLFYVPWA